MHDIDADEASTHGIQWPSCTRHVRYDVCALCPRPSVSALQSSTYRLEMRRNYVFATCSMQQQQQRAAPLVSRVVVSSVGGHNPSSIRSRGKPPWGC